MEVEEILASDETFFRNTYDAWKAGKLNGWKNKPQKTAKRLKFDKFVKKFNKGIVREFLDLYAPLSTEYLIYTNMFWVDRGRAVLTNFRFFLKREEGYIYIPYHKLTKYVNSKKKLQNGMEISYKITIYYKENSHETYAFTTYDYLGIHYNDIDYIISRREWINLTSFERELLTMTRTEAEKEMGKLRIKAEEERERKRLTEEAKRRAPASPPPHIDKGMVQKMYAFEKSKNAKFTFGDLSAYRRLNKIGSGGFSEVYLVDRDGRNYAMKVPRDVDFAGNDTLLLREKDVENYGREAEIWASLTEKAPNSVVNLIDAGVRPFPWFVMEIGERKLGDAVGTASPQEKLRIISELLGKLDRIHHYGVVHKDIKPDNILFAGGNWKFTDFGLSKVLSMSSKSSAGFSGTMFYMAPEQVSRKHFGNTDWRTDIWQMGVLAYEVLTGHTPFEAEDAFEITGMILRDEPIPGTRYGMDERVWNVVKKALEKRKEERWQSAGEFKTALNGDGNLRGNNRNLYSNHSYQRRNANKLKKNRHREEGDDVFRL